MLEAGTTIKLTAKGMQVAEGYGPTGTMDLNCPYYEVAFDVSYGQLLDGFVKVRPKYTREYRLSQGYIATYGINPLSVPVILLAAPERVDYWATADPIGHSHNLPHRYEFTYVEQLHAPTFSQVIDDMLTQVTDEHRNLARAEYLDTRYAIRWSVDRLTE